MGNSEKKRAGKYHDRDKRIVDGLRSPDPELRNQAVLELEEQLRGPFIKALRGKVKSGNGTGLFVDVFYHNLRIRIVVFEEIWQATKSVLIKKVKNKDFEIDRSLLSYLVNIAGYKVMERRRREAKCSKLPITYQSDIAATSTEADSQGVTDLLITIKEFCDHLNEDDKLALFVGVSYMTSTCSNRKTQKELATRIRNSGAWDGSDATIVRRYNRLLDELRDVLRDGGYDV